jgi:AcrR family transcriptional regulator
MTTGKTARGPYAKTAQKRAMVADAALAVVLEAGHRALTTAEVASRAGISERTMLYHFPTRDHLLVAALERADEVVSTQPMDRETLLEEGLFAIPRLTLSGVSSVSSDANIVKLYNAMSGQADDPAHPAHEYFRSRYSRTLETFEHLVRQQQETGGAHPDLDPARVARQLHGVWSGLQAIWAVDPSFDLLADLDDAFRRLTGQRELQARTVLGELAERL